MRQPLPAAYQAAHQGAPYAAHLTPATRTRASTTATPASATKPHPLALLLMAASTCVFS